MSSARLHSWKNRDAAAVFDLVELRECDWIKQKRECGVGA